MFKAVLSQMSVDILNLDELKINENTFINFEYIFYSKNTGNENINLVNMLRISNKQYIVFNVIE